VALAAVAKQGESFHDIAVLLTNTVKNKRTELHCSVRFFVGPEKNQTYWCPDKRLTESPRVYTKQLRHKQASQGLSINRLRRATHQPSG
jgi:predicted metal-dependent enzyme (double-stranded beta helix superfamily)